jgi:N-acetylglucosamine transport system substrate-binding protein
MSETSKIGRRSLLRGSLATAAVLPLGGALASCAASGSNDDNSSQGG